MTYRGPLRREDVLAIVAEPATLSELAAYFAALSLDDATGFTGSRFERLEGGGDREDVAGRITSGDLLAVTMLSVRVPTRVALRLREGELGDQVGVQVARIPTSVEVGSPAAGTLLATAGPADAAWQLLASQPGVGWVTAGKLLARKRPRLVPVWDSVVRCAFGRPSSPWAWMQGLFEADGGSLPRLLTRVRDEAEVPPEISSLRVLDVIVWMRHRADHRTSRCLRAGLPALANVSP